MPRRGVKLRWRFGRWRGDGVCAIVLRWGVYGLGVELWCESTASVGGLGACKIVLRSLRLMRLISQSWDFKESALNIPHADCQAQKFSVPTLCGNYAGFQLSPTDAGSR